MTTRSFNSLVDLSTGVSIELVLSTPVDSNILGGEHESHKLAVCLHPWSWLGGQMNDPVILSLEDSLHAANHSVLRYNSRGVGKSSGWPSLTGLKEEKDLQAVVQWAVEKLGNVVSIVILGYSYGSLIASTYPLALFPGISVSHVLISYPLGTRGLLTLFHSSTFIEKLNKLLVDEHSKILVIYGDKDEFTSISKYRAWKSDLENVPRAPKASLKIIEVPNATHFWGGEGRSVLVEELQKWLQ